MLCSGSVLFFLNAMYILYYITIILLLLPSNILMLFVSEVGNLYFLRPLTLAFNRTWRIFFSRLIIIIIQYYATATVQWGFATRAGMMCTPNNKDRHYIPLLFCIICIIYLLIVVRAENSECEILFRSRGKQ